MNEGEIKAVLLEEIGNIAPEADLSRLKPDVNFREELDINSMGFLTLVIALSNRLAVDIPERDYPRMFSLEGTIAYLVAAKR